ncbi:MAG: HlyC/CorC family transporter [Acidobacteria bacterium]|nr:HlyC/CorC family transporter [Acidobacteriota bacterium]
MSTPEVAAIVAVLALVVTAAFLAAAETSLTHLPRAQALALEEEGRRGAASLSRMLERREDILSPILFLVLLCHLVAASLVTLLAESYLGPLGIVVAVVGEVVVIFVVAEAAPKTYALQHPLRTALFVAPAVRFLAASLPVRLLTRALIGASNILLPGKGHPAGPAASEEELLALADVAVEAGEIESEERTLIRSIIDFGDTVAREVMVPRPDMVTVPASVTVGEAMEISIANGYSRIPAYDAGGIDDIVGIVYAKDLMRAARETGAETPVRGLLRQALFVPETKRVSELMREMQAKQMHMVIVVDEYGGTAGLATLEDLIEELIGEIVDEFDVEDPLLEPLPNGDWRVNARMALDEVNELLHLALPEGDWDTVGGLVFNLLGHVPAEGETVEVGTHLLRAERVQGRRIGRVRITRMAGARS